jgi:drug/metabolite transporter (DMT)-like permease
MTGLLLALLASFSWGISDFLGGLKTRRIALSIVLGVSQVAGMVVLATPLIIRHRPLVVDAHLLPAMGAGVGSVLALGLLYLAMAKGNIVVVAPIASTGAVLPVVVGITRGDTLSAIAVVGLVLALAGAATAAFEPGGKGVGSGRLVGGVALAFGSALALGFFFTLLDAASEGDPYWATFVMRSTACVLVLLFLVARRRRIDPDQRITERSDLPALVGIGVFDAIAEISFAVASTSGQLSVVSVLSSLYPAVTVLFAVVLLRERVHASQAIGAIGALAGVVLIAQAT